MDTITDYTEYWVAIAIRRTVPPFLIVLGTLGNILVICVLLRKRNRKQSFSIYLTTLACFDLLAIYSGLLGLWLQSLVGNENLNTVGCKILLFCLYFAEDVSSWILVAVTTERALGVWLPHKTRSYCTLKTSCVTIITIVIFLAVLNSHFFFGVVKNEEANSCLGTTSDGYKRFLVNIWPWIDMCAFCLIPFVALFVGNVSIIIKLFLNRRRKVSRVNPSARVSVISDSNGISGNSLSQLPDRFDRVIPTLILLCVVFSICTLPISAFLLHDINVDVSLLTPHELAKRKLVIAILKLLMYVNSVINFILYFLNDNRFRKEVQRFICCRK